MRSTYRFSLLFLVTILSLTAFGADADQRAARLVTSARAIEWQRPIDSAAPFLSVQRPDGEVITGMFGGGRTPMLQLDGLADGLYSYELRVAQEDGSPLVQSGSFTVAKGAFVSPYAVERAALSARPLRPSVNT